MAAPQPSLIPPATEKNQENTSQPRDLGRVSCLNGRNGLRWNHSSPRPSLDSGSSVHVRLHVVLGEMDLRAPPRDIDHRPKSDEPVPVSNDPLDPADPLGISDDGDATDTRQYIECA